MISLPTFIMKDIEDPYIRENFKRLTVFLQDFPFFRGEWVFIEHEFTAAVTELELPHGLAFKPTDIIVTSVHGGTIGVSAVEFHFDDFDETNLNVTATEACTVRFFAGAYKEESSRTGR